MKNVKQWVGDFGSGVLGFLVLALCCVPIIVLGIYLENNPIAKDIISLFMCTAPIFIAYWIAKEDRWYKINWIRFFGVLLFIYVVIKTPGSILNLGDHGRVY